MTTETYGLAMSPLRPLGVLAQATEVGADLSKVPRRILMDCLETSPVLVLRGFSLLSGGDLLDCCCSWGEVLTWDFGSVLELSVHEDPKNYLFTNGDVPFHWDGAFAEATPRYIVFQCIDAPDSGGETLFCDTIRVFEQASETQKARWAELVITYRTDKIAHYGGQVTVPLVSAHPGNGLPRLRYAEPLDPAQFLNPLVVDVGALPEGRTDEFFDEMRSCLYQPSVCYAHAWQDGDVLIADNHALLHGRRRFNRGSRRRLQRVHIL